MSSYQVAQAVVQDLLKDKNTIIDNFNSNRIVSIPQDIKLELNDGTLALKAGSKVWYPDGLNEDGSKKFSSVVISTDITRTVTPDTSLLFFYDNGSLEYSASSFQCFSGDIAPTTTQTCITWYDTASNYIKASSDGGQSWSTGRSLPICIISTVNFIDQVFNGFGYIGSTCYVLPGVTGYIPKGLNSDGTLINEIITQTKVSITTVTTSWGTGSEVFFFNGIDTYIHRALPNCFYQATQPIVKDIDNYWFNTETGKFYETKNSGTSWSEFKAIPAFTITFDNGTITSLKSCGVYNFVNSNATNLSNYGRQIISGLGKPSNKYIDLTVGASGTTYRAPANGYIYCNGHANASPAYISIDIPNSQYCGINGVAGYDLTTNQIALKLGDRFTLRYDNTTINAFRFIYDKGYS